MEAMRRSTPADFWRAVDIQSSGCWLWTRATWGNNHYGCVKFQGRALSAHRLAYELAKGPIPAALKVLHICDIPRCVNPDHLFIGTQRENMLDCKAKGRTRNGHSYATHCKRGHAFDEVNTRFDGRGRQCRTCDKLRRTPIADAKAKDRIERAQCRALRKDGGKNVSR